jgi:hypothetical protein
VSVRAPDEAGDYVLRYHLASSYRVIGSAPLKITPATASVSAPAEVVAGKVFEVAWKGPDNETDFITVVEAGAPDKKYGGSNGYTRRGNPVRIEAPREAGDYELRRRNSALRRGRHPASSPSPATRLRRLERTQPSSFCWMRRAACCSASAANAA